jgi:peptide/nickel transport system substrate-binding protein
MAVEEAVARGELLAGRYAIGQRVGQAGGQGTVYRALDEVTGAYVAVKVLHPHIYRGDRAQVEAEIKVLRAIRSAHVIRLLDAVDVPAAFGRPATRALVMELADSSLEDHIEEGRGAPPRILRTALDHAAAGLADLHAARVTHNDVKPSNILCCGDRWKLADFGIATALDGTHAYHSWQDTAYAAPERSARGEVRPEGDVWSYGMTVYRAVTGQAGTPARGRLKDLETPWRQLVSSCLVDNPTQRLGLADLRSKLPHLPEHTLTRPRQEAPVPADPPGRPPRPVAGIVATVVVLALVAISATVVLRWHLGTDRENGSGGPAPMVPPPLHGGGLVYAIFADPNGLDPTKNAWDTSGLQVANALFDPLMAYDAKGGLAPYLAKGLTASADYKTWTLDLRSGVTFHNGDELDADSVVTCLKALRRSIITGSAMQMITDTVAMDRLTVRITTSRPWAALPSLLAGQAGYVVSPVQLADPDGSSKPIGTGPFSLHGWQINQRFELVRNLAYWRDGLPYLDSVRFEVVPDGPRRIEMLERGEIDVATFNSTADLAALDEAVSRRAPTTGPDGRSGALVVERDQGDTEKDTILFNTSKPPLNDLRIRQALAYATDVKALAEANGWPEDRLANGFLPPDSPFYTPVAYPTFDLTRARTLAQAYKFEKNLRDISFTLTEAFEPGFLPMLIDQWARAGINVRINSVEGKQLVRYAVTGQYDAMHLVYFASPDPDTFWHFFVSDSIRSPISLNFAQLRDARIDEGFNEARASADPGIRKEGYAKVQEALADQLPYLWLLRDEWRIATVSRVRDARSMTLPDGQPAMPFVDGSHRLTETWIS